jgi:hypothetical protein
MSLMRQRIDAIRNTRRMYGDHADSVATYLSTTGQAHEVEGAVAEIQAFEEAAVQEIIEATTLDNTD